MYHYVRPDHLDLPYFRHLHVEDFGAQLDYFGTEFGYVSRRDFEASLESGQPPRGVVLTFDDGFRDHFDHVFPALTARGLWGIFYVPAGPYLTGRLLDVHCLHLLLGAFGGEQVAEATRRLVRTEMVTDAHREEFARETYVRQDNTANTNYVKRLLNYFIDYRYRGAIMDELMRLFFPEKPDLAKQFYMSPAELREMHKRGMWIGSHSVRHPVMSKLTIAEQEAEIKDSFAWLGSITGGGSPTFCYPYGGFHSFTPDTERLLGKYGCRFSFNVEQRDVSASDLRNRPQALPRYDCNAFPHGSCRVRPRI